MSVPDAGSFHQDMLVFLQYVVRRLRTPVGIAVSHVVVSQAHDLAELRPAYWTAAGKQLRQSSLGQTAWGTAPVSAAAIRTGNVQRTDGVAIHFR